MINHKKRKILCVSLLILFVSSSNMVNADDECANTIEMTDYILWQQTFDFTIERFSDRLSYYGACTNDQGIAEVLVFQARVSGNHNNYFFVDPISGEELWNLNDRGGPSFEDVLLFDYTGNGIQEVIVHIPARLEKGRIQRVPGHGLYVYDAPTGELYYWEGWNFNANDQITAGLAEYPNSQYELVSWSFATPDGVPPSIPGNDVVDPINGDYDVYLNWDNLFPGQDFKVDFVFQYTGSIPAKLWADYVLVNDDDGLLQQLLDDEAVNIKAYTATGTPGQAWHINMGEPVDVGYQIHTGEYIYVKMTIHLPQNNWYQGLSGSFAASIGAIQWTDPCDEEPLCDPGLELIQNGGFEYPVVTHSAKWDIFPSGTPDLGWHVEWIIDEHPQLPDVANLELHRGVNNWAAYEGDQYAELDSDFDGPGGSINNEPASVRIYQDITTVPGRAYTLSFAFSPRPGTNAAQNILNVNWDGETVDILIADGTGKTNTDWTVYTYEVVASSEITRVAFADDGIPNSMGTFLDAVSVRAICR
jgi:hypothetical protein